jgi:hypothetical protein
MASGYVCVKVRPSCELFCLPFLLFRLLAQFCFMFSFFFHLSLLFFRALLPLRCLFEILEQSFVVGCAATGHCA